MELREILQVTWRRLWLILLGTLLISVIVFVVSVNMTPVYQAKVTMMVNQATSTTPFSTYIGTGEELTLTYSELLKTRPLLEVVIANLGLDLSPDDLLEDMIDTNLIPDTQLLALTVEDTDAQRASGIANEIAVMFISLQNTEKQLQNIVALEQDVVAQMASVKELIEYNQSIIDQSRLSSGLLVEEEFTSAQDALASQQSAYAGLLGTYLNIRLTQAQLLDLTVVEPAIAPTTPVRPNIFLYTFLGAFIGLVFSAGLVFLVEYLERSFETEDDVRQVLSLPALGAIPQLQGRERDNALVTVTLPRAPVSEAYRTLRTNVRFASVDKPLTTLLITSSEPGAGKTTVASNLGVVFAQAGLQVVLIDADVRLPSLHRLFGLSNHTGLTDLLVGDVQDVGQCMIETETDNLRLLTSGPVPPNPSELLGSKRMEAVLAEVQENTDLVILDSPPALAVTDPVVLAAEVDGVILVIEAKRTSHEAARAACEAYRRAGVTILGAVLTKVKVRRKSSSYYYYVANERPAQLSIWRRWSDRFTKSG
jgi:succinoglycan biosynthesis transport protein ExoP